MSSLAWLPSTLAHALLSSALKIVKYTLFKCRVAAGGGSGEEGGEGEHIQSFWRYDLWPSQCVCVVAIVYSFVYANCELLRKKKTNKLQDKIEPRGSL